MGGEATSFTIEALDRETGQWGEVGVLPEARAGCAVAVVGTKIYVFGGGGGMSDAFLSTWTAFDVADGTWTKLPASARALPHPFCHGQAATCTMEG